MPIAALTREHCGCNTPGASSPADRGIRWNLPSAEWTVD